MINLIDETIENISKISRQVKWSSYEGYLVKTDYRNIEVLINSDQDCL